VVVVPPLPVAPPPYPVVPPLPDDVDDWEHPPLAKAMAHRTASACFIAMLHHGVLARRGVSPSNRVFIDRRREVPAGEKCTASPHFSQQRTKIGGRAG
jgi:hypothetical protein